MSHCRITLSWQCASSSPRRRSNDYASSVRTFISLASSSCTPVDNRQQLTEVVRPYRVLYDRLQTTTTPSNPYALHSAPHLSALASNPSSALPPTILDKPSYPLADPQAPQLFLQQLDARKLAAVKNGEEFGARPLEGVEGESKPDLRTVEGTALVSGSAEASGSGMQVDA